MTVKEVADTAVKTGKTVEKVIKKAWSVLDTAVHKETPTQYLSDAGIRAIQGKE